ncbi:MAG: hypothetical protein HPY45_02880 [Anaerolineae bacterium]|nr:hypothetical protein [Anaerolineae bacterium]
MKFRHLLVICIVFIAGCNLPRATSTPSADQVATSVAQTLTVLAIPASPQPESPTVTPQIQNTQTPQPTLTASVAPSETPTPEATISTTPTLTSSPTSSPDDPKKTLGAPTKLLSMDSGAAFGISGTYQDDAGNSISVANGVMTLYNPNYNGFLTWRLTSKTSNNYYIEAVFQTKNCAASDQYGLVTRAPDYTSGYGYYFGFTCDGSYTFIRRDENGVFTIIAAIPSSHIKSGADQVNRMGILAKGNLFKLFANDKLLQETSDSIITAGGHYGPYIVGRSGSHTVNLDEISYWSLP